MSDLDVIDPAGTPVEFGGKTIMVKPLKVGQLPAFARAIKPLTGTLEAMATGAAVLNVGAFVGLVDEHSEALVQAVSIATGIPVDQINEATLDQLLVLIVGVVKVNADFFKGRLTPAILAAVNQALPQSAPTPGAGPTA